MKLPVVQIKDTILAKFTKLKPDEIRSGILVPVNSSANAFNSLEYALKLAKTLQNTIHLFYVIDVNLDELSESTIVAHHVLERAYKKAENCVESLREMIEESGVKVTTAEFRIGSVGTLIQKRVEDLRPGMIVIGRDCFSRKTINKLIRNASCPLIAIPECITPKLPSSVILTNEHSSFSERTIEPLIKIINSTTRALTILSFVKLNQSKIQKISVPHISTTNVMVNVEQIEHLPSTNRVDDFVRAGAVDLVCTTYQGPSFFQRFFSSNFPTEIVFGLSVPTMVLRGS
jgi:nucleotide-binding universal stress UspA family protein